MKRYVLTYWWFGPDTMVPAGLPRTGVAVVQDPPRVYGVTAATSPLVAAAITQFRDEAGDTAHTGNFLVLSVIDLSTLDVVGRGFTVDGAQVFAGPTEDDIDADRSGRHLDAAETHAGVGGPNEYVVTGTITGDDQRFVQRVTERSVGGALDSVLDWLASKGLDDTVVEVWSVVAREGDAVHVYRGTEKYRRPGQVDTSGASWRRGEYEEVLLAAAPTPVHPPGLLEKVNRDRARRGALPLAPGEWSTADLEEFAQHLRRNPRALKRRLLR